MSFWYTYTELCRRGAIFYSAAALAGSFNGLIAYGIEKNLAGAHGWTAWQWLFLVEGVLPIGCAVIILVLLPPTPEQGHFIFSKAERALAIRRSRRAFNPVDAQIRPKLMIQPLLSPFFWGLALVYMCNHFALSSLTNFLPSIIQGFGFSSVKAQLWSVIVYACALVGTNVFAWIADKTDRRGLPLIGASSFALVGYIMLMAITNNSGRFAGTCILCFGLFATIPISTSWITLTVAGYTQRATSVAAINMISQAFSIAGNQAYIDPPLCESAPEGIRPPRVAGLLTDKQTAKAWPRRSASRRRTLWLCWACCCWCATPTPRRTSTAASCRRRRWRRSRRRRGICWATSTSTSGTTTKRRHCRLAKRQASEEQKRATARRTEKETQYTLPLPLAPCPLPLSPFDRSTVHRPSATCTVHVIKQGVRQE